MPVLGLVLVLVLRAVQPAGTTCHGPLTLQPGCRPPAMLVARAPGTPPPRQQSTRRATARLVSARTPAQRGWTTQRWPASSSTPSRRRPTMPRCSRRCRAMLVLSLSPPPLRCITRSCGALFDCSGWTSRCEWPAAQRSDAAALTHRHPRPPTFAAGQPDSKRLVALAWELLHRHCPCACGQFAAAWVRYCSHGSRTGDISLRAGPAAGGRRAARLLHTRTGARFTRHRQPSGRRRPSSQFQRSRRRCGRH